MVFLWLEDPDPVFSRIRATQKDRIRIRNTAYKQKKSVFFLKDKLFKRRVLGIIGPRGGSRAKGGT